MKTEIGPQKGKVVRLGPELRFGYVADAAGAHHYIFVVGAAISHREAARLRVGSEVRFDVVDNGRVERLALI